MAIATPSDPYEVDESILPFTTAVGALCIEWTGLERTVGLGLAHVMGLPLDQHSFTIIRHFDFRQQLAALKAAAVIRIPETRCRDALVSTVDYIDNFLRPRRNRFVHDQWHLDWDAEGETIRRQNLTPRTYRPQSHHDLICEIHPPEIQDIDELHTTIWEVVEHSGLVEQLSYYWKPDTPERDERIAALIATPPQRSFLPPRTERLHPRGNPPLPERIQ